MRSVNVASLVGTHKRVALFGASGTIGRALARVLVEKGHDLVCFIRPACDLRIEGACSVSCDLNDAAALKHQLTGEEKAFDLVISCIASRSGGHEDAWLVDYGMNHKILEAAKESGAAHFILLSAICVQKPQLPFQHAKLAFEQELRESGVRWTIVRPTAFFKSLSGQIERVRQGKPYLLIGNGKLTRCKPISDPDLAHFISDCITDPDKHNRILPIGGPGPAITPLQQG